MLDEISKNPPVDGAPREKKRAPVYLIFEALWIERVHAVRVPINDSIIQTQAHSLIEEFSGQEESVEDYIDFQRSGGWLSAFKARNGICRQKFESEGRPRLPSDIEVARLKLREDVRGYSLRDI